jgi:hypothetical protein
MHKILSEAFECALLPFSAVVFVFLNSRIFTNAM